jgi:hypothetical protein
VKTALSEATRIGWTLKDDLDGYVAPVLIERFNKAAGLAGDGKYDDAVVVYQEMLNPGLDREDWVASTNFFGQVYMRFAWVYMDMLEWQQAKSVLNYGPVLDAISAFDLPTQASYHYCLANVLGNLGECDAMDATMRRSMKIQSYLKNQDEIFNCFKCLFDRAKEKGWTTYIKDLEEELKGE